MKYAPMKNQRTQRPVNPNGNQYRTEREKQHDRSNGTIKRNWSTM